MTRIHISQTSAWQPVQLQAKQWLDIRQESHVLLSRVWQDPSWDKIAVRQIIEAYEEATHTCVGCE